MTDSFRWGGFDLRKFCRVFFRNFWMIIAVMIITYQGLTLVDKQTYTPSYTSTAVAAVYPSTSSYRYHTIESVSDLALKTSIIVSTLNSELFQSGFHNQYLSLQDCTIDSLQVPNTDLLILQATSSRPENAFEGIPVALEYFSQFSGNMTAASEINIILGPRAPYLAGGSTIRANRARLCLLSGLMMAGLLLLMYVAKATYKTERCIRRRYKNVRFFSLPFISSGADSIKGIFSKKRIQEPIKKLTIEIKQLLHKCDKKTLLVASNTNNKGVSPVISVLARELAEQNEKVILIGSEAGQYDSAPGLDPSDLMEKHTFQDVLQQKCTVEDAMFYSDELKAHCIQFGQDNTEADPSYSADDIRRVLSDCLEYADIILINGTAWNLPHYAQIWNKSVDASIALCRQDDADYFKVDQMLNDLQNSDTYFAGCILFGF